MGLYSSDAGRGAPFGHDPPYKRVPCSTCKAKVGQKCINAKTGRYYESNPGHKSRLDVAKEQKLKGVAHAAARYRRRSS